MKISDFYYKNYKQLLVIPFIILFLSIAVIAVHYFQTGEFVEKSVSLKGGSTITVQTPQKIDLAAFQAELQKITTEDVIVRELTSGASQIGLTIETTLLDPSEIISHIKQEHPDATLTVETIGPSLGASFFRQTIYSVIVAFLLMAIIVFLYFRTPLPSSYIILSAISDMLFAWAMILLLNVKLSTAGVAAFLMLIGYSIDTDMLLTIRVLKRKEDDLRTRIMSSVGTGTTMTFTALAATITAYIISPAEAMKQIMLILTFGLFADLWNTWLQNVGLLRLYLDKRAEK